MSSIDPSSPAAAAADSATSGVAAMSERPGSDTRISAEVAAVLVATALGAVVRLIPAIAAGFPLNDGGLFVTMARDIVAAGVPLPATTTYNGLDIPFAYPPLALDATALLLGTTGGDGILIARFAPPTVAVLSIPLVYLLARELLPSRFHAFVAALLFAFVPRSFEWLIMGGGLTRAPGLCLAVGTLVVLLMALRRGSLLLAAIAGVLLGATALTHPQAAVFAGLSTIVLWAFAARSRRQWGEAGLALAVGAAITLPWALAVLAAHGPGPLLSAGSSGFNPIESVIYLTSFALTDEALWRPVMILSVIGFLFQLSRRRWLLPVWTVVLVLADPRSAATFSAIPLSMLGAVGLIDVLVERLFPGAFPFDPGSVWPPSVVRRRSFEALFFVLLLLGIAGGLFASVAPAYITPVPAEARTAMAWVRDSTAPHARILVVSGRDWFDDAVAEWFPTLTDRRSVATVQGHEWLGRDAWNAQVAASAQLADCATRTVSCVEAWMAEHDEADYIFVPKGLVDGITGASDCCVPLRETLSTAPGYVVVYDGPGATIARIERQAAPAPVLSSAP